MSTDNNIPQEAVTQSINEQLIAVLRPVLHSLPLEVVKAATPAEARGGDITDEAAAKWVKETAPDQVLALMGPLSLESFPKEDISKFLSEIDLSEYIEDQGLISYEEAQEWVKNHVPLSDMYSTQDLIKHLKECSRSSEIFDSSELAQLFHMADDKPEMDELYDYHEIGEFISDRDIGDFVDSETLSEWVCDNVYLADLIDDHYGWDDAAEVVSSHVSLDTVANEYAESDVEEWVKGEYDALSKYDVSEFRQHFCNECITLGQVYSKSDIMDYVQDYEVTEWYHPEMIQANLSPSDIFTTTQMLENLDRVFKGMQERVRELTNRQAVNN
jgi:hypothetical protein